MHCAAPTAALSHADDYNDEAISVPTVSVMLSKNGAKFKLLIADACRSRGGSDAAVHAEVKGGGSAAVPKLSYAALQQSDLAANTYARRTRVVLGQGEGSTVRIRGWSEGSTKALPSCGLAANTCARRPGTRPRGGAHGIGI